MRATQPDRELTTVIAEASRALTRLDVDRLEELAAWCGSLSGDPRSLTGDEWRRQAREASRKMATLAGVLDATRANVSVMKRLRELRAGNPEYRE